MKFTRILALFLALLMLALTVVACDEEPDPAPVNPDTPPVEENPDNTEETTDPEQLDLVTKGETEYVIVRDYKAGPEVVDAVATIAEAFRIHLGATIEVKLCYNDIENEPTDVEQAKEILVGVTNRKESQEVLGGMLCKDYTMQIKGEKLILGGAGDSGTATALTTFMTGFIFEQGNRFGVANNGEKYDLVFKKENNTVNRATTYSYSNFTMLGARIDSYLIAYPKNGELAQVSKELAEKIYTHVSDNTGYELEMSKDTRAWGDYEILIGDTIRTVEGLYEELADDEYFIRLVSKEVTYEDGSVHEGATLYICFGEDAADAAFEAFSKQMMPASTTLVELNLEENYTLTNKK